MRLPVCVMTFASPADRVRSANGTVVTDTNDSAGIGPM